MNLDQGTWPGGPIELRLRELTHRSCQGATASGGAA